jgi:hypothetical protein
LIRIGNAQGFWGDDVDAAARLIKQASQLDYLTLDYLAEVSLSIMAIQREKDPSLGYARDFIQVVLSLVPLWKKGVKTRIVTNAGGLNPEGCAREVQRVLTENGCANLKVGVVSGDDVLPLLRNPGKSTLPLHRNLETGKPLRDIASQLVTASAYVGADEVARVIRAGADIVVTGRVADPSLTVAPCLAHFGWRPGVNGYLNRVASATVAGHLIECGTQVTGGFNTDWMNIPSPETMGFPIIEMEEDGGFVVTKPARTGGRVDIQTVKEQLLYEIGDPGSYLSPDVTVSLLGIDLKKVGKDRVRVIGAQGTPATPTYKVSATYRDGFRGHGTLVIFGRDAVRKARRTGNVILSRLKRAGFAPQRSLVEVLGAGECVPGVKLGLPTKELQEVVLRVSVADSRKEVVERFSREFAPMVTSGPQGVTGYANARIRPIPVFAYWPCLIPKDLVKVKGELL